MDGATLEVSAGVSHVDRLDASGGHPEDRAYGSSSFGGWPGGSGQKP